MEEARYRALFIAMFMLMLMIGGKCSYLRATSAHLVGHLPIPWYQAMRYLDRYAPGWRYEIRSINQIGENLVMLARIVIPCVEGEVWREASALERIEHPKRYGDAATNAESAALRRAAAKFGLCLNLYDK
jgi:hypothetical protein